jgi:hypothetical protein
MARFSMFADDVSGARHCSLLLPNDIRQVWITTDTQARGECIVRVGSF